MIEYIEGDIFNSPAQVIVNTVNTVGVMGKGLALSFKNKYPQMFESYKKVCDKKLLKTGKLLLYYSPDHWILSFPTKEHWRNPSRLEYIEAGLIKFTNCYAQKNITSIAFPKLGCGNGELNWDDVKPIMEKYLKPLPIDIYIYIGLNEDNTPEHIDANKTIRWLRSNAKDMSFRGLLDDISQQCSSLLPYEITDTSSIIKSQNKFIFKLESSEFIVNEDDLHIIWDEIRNKLIFEKSTDCKKLLFCELLLKLGYLSNIRLYNKTGTLIEGYQLNEGLGRAFGLEEY